MRIAVLLACATLALGLRAEEKAADAPHSYRVDFTLRDKADNGGARHFSLLADTGGAVSLLRTGTRVPVLSGKEEFNYVDFGVNIDCRVREQAGRPLLSATIEVNSLGGGGAAAPARPQIPQTRVSVYATVQPGKPTLVAHIDDPVLQRNFDVEATLVRVD